MVNSKLNKYELSMSDVVEREVHIIYWTSLRIGKGGCIYEVESFYSLFSWSLRLASVQNVTIDSLIVWNPLIILLEISIQSNSNNLELD